MAADAIDAPPSFDEDWSPNDGAIFPRLPPLINNGVGTTRALAIPEPTMSKIESIVAVYQTHSDAEEAIKELQHAGIDMKNLSIVAKDYHTDEQVVGYYNAGDRMKRWGTTGAFWGGFWGLLFGSAFFAIPGIGPLLVAGPLVAWIVGGLEGAAVVGGASALGAGLFSIGIPKDSVLEYELAVKNDKFLLIVSGTTAEVAKARQTLEATHPAQIALHSPEEVGAAV